jgi:thiol-disulfide isomerase/thioredoxin
MNKKERVFYIRHFVKRQHMELSIIFQLLGWIALGIIVYMTYTNVQALLVKKTSAVSLPVEITTDVEQVKFLFFSARWCPWSKKARPHWDALKEDMKINPATFGGKMVQLEEIDGDIDISKRKEYGVSAYPSFKLVMSDGVKTMTSIPTRDGMHDFLIRSLGPEEPIKLTTSA